MTLIWGFPSLFLQNTEKNGIVKIKTMKVKHFMTKLLGLFLSALNFVNM